MTRRRPSPDQLREQHPAAYALGIVAGWLLLLVVCLLLIASLSIIVAVALYAIGWPA